VLGAFGSCAPRYLMGARGFGAARERGGAFRAVEPLLRSARGHVRERVCCLGFTSSAFTSTSVAKSTTGCSLGRIITQELEQRGYRVTRKGVPSAGLARPDYSVTTLQPCSFTSARMTRRRSGISVSHRIYPRPTTESCWTPMPSTNWRPGDSMFGDLPVSGVSGTHAVVASAPTRPFGMTRSPR
jgi:hypothetical protein